MRDASLFCLLFVGCSGSAAPAATASSLPVDLVPATSARGVVCSMEGLAGDATLRFDASGLPVSRHENSDAAGSQYEERWVRDAQGRTVRIERELIEGMGEVGPRPDIVVTYPANPTERTLDVRHESDDDGVVLVRWTYDVRGLPVRREERYEESEEPIVETCEYDRLGRVTRRDDQRFGYVGDASFPSWMTTPHDPEIVVHPDRFYDTYRVPDGGLSRFEIGSMSSNWYGACRDAFFEPCSPVFAPPPPGGTRVTQAATLRLAPAPSPDEVARRDLQCTNPDPEAEDGCSFEVVHRVERADGELRGVAVLRLGRGPQESQSHHLAMALEDGWWLGPMIGDGPFNGNQTSGTFMFETDEAQLRQVIAGDEPEFTLRYRTEGIRDNSEHETAEDGIIVCVDLAQRSLRCVRIPEHVREVTENGLREARVRIDFPGDGMVSVEPVSGAHPRVASEAFPVEWLFER